jgi:hypothetical protein
MQKKRFKIAAVFLVAAFFLIPQSVLALSLSVNVPEKYTIVKPGERLYFLIDVQYPENTKRKDLRLTYEIKQDDFIFAEMKALRAVEAQASFMDFVVIPESIKKGRYLIDVKVEDYEALSQNVSASFEVKTKIDTGQMLFYIFVFFQSLLFAAVLVAVIIFLINKSKIKN